jgi:hypothetical protein
VFLCRLPPEKAIDQLVSFRAEHRFAQAHGVLTDTNHEKVLDFCQGGSRRPGAIFQSGNRDGDIAIHLDD